MPKIKDYPVICKRKHQLSKCEKCGYIDFPKLIEFDGKVHKYCETCAFQIRNRISKENRNGKNSIAPHQL
jgi:hypothetical protein